MAFLLVDEGFSDVILCHLLVFVYVIVNQYCFGF